MYSPLTSDGPQIGSQVTSWDDERSHCCGWFVCSCIISFHAESRGVLMTQLDQSFENLSKRSLHSNIRPRNICFPALYFVFLLDKAFIYFHDRHERNLKCQGVHHIIPRWSRRGRAEKLLIPLLTGIALCSSHVFCIEIQGMFLHRWGLLLGIFSQLVPISWSSFPCKHSWMDATAKLVTVGGLETSVLFLFTYPWWSVFPITQGP